MTPLHNEHVIKYFSFAAWVCKKTSKFVSYEFWRQWHEDELYANTLVEYFTMKKDINNV